ncbi:MAG: dihydroneopterin triphosphate diphosphatase [Neisseria sp.]|nr:dihydroneopterin triphosphate diphosphatase [Neisseria sp.]
MTYKTPISVLVLLHDGMGNALLLQRADGENLWQSVTGSIEANETLPETALREVREETGIQAGCDALCDWQIFSDYEIFPRWRHRYPPQVTHNREHVFSLCIPADTVIQLNPREHIAYRWLPCDQAATQVFSPSNAAMLQALARRIKFPIIES